MHLQPSSTLASTPTRASSRACRSQATRPSAGRRAPQPRDVPLGWVTRPSAARRAPQLGDAPLSRATCPSAGRRAPQPRDVPLSWATHPSAGRRAPQPRDAPLSWATRPSTAAIHASVHDGVCASLNYCLGQQPQLDYRVCGLAEGAGVCQEKERDRLHREQKVFMRSGMQMQCGTTSIQFYCSLDYSSLYSDENRIKCLCFVHVHL